MVLSGDQPPFKVTVPSLCSVTGYDSGRLQEAMSERIVRKTLEIDDDIQAGITDWKVFFQSKQLPKYLVGTLRCIGSGPLCGLSDVSLSNK